MSRITLGIFCTALLSIASMQATKSYKKDRSPNVSSARELAQDTVCFHWIYLPREDRDVVRMERMVDTDGHFLTKQLLPRRVDLDKPFLTKELLPILVESTGKNRPDDFIPLKHSSLIDMPHMATEKARELRSLAAQQPIQKENT